MSDKTYVKVTDEADDRFGQVGFVGMGSHNDWEVHFDDGTSKYYHSLSLQPTEPPTIRE